MKTRVVAFCGVVLAIICLIVWLRNRAEPQPKGSLSTETAPTNKRWSGESPQPPRPNGAENTSAQPTAPQPAPVTTEASAPHPPALSPAQSNALNQRILAEWQAPIDFYGKVVDENSNAVAGATVAFRWVEAPNEAGNRTASAQSDADGLFALHGERGLSLGVSVEKEGYYSSRRDSDTFNYGRLKGEPFHPDLRNPVVFHLRKKGSGEPLLHVGGIGLRTMRDFLLAPDGKPAEVSLRDGRSVPLGQGDLRVEFQAGQALDNFPSRITWQCRVTVPDGGLLQTDEEYPFLAPESGYSASDEWSIGATNWTEQVQKVYYVKLRDGSFGRATVRVIGTARRAFFRLESYLNPSGSRNLEPAG